MISWPIDLLSLKPKFFSICKCFIGNIPASFSDGFSEFKSYVNDRFFNYKIGINGSKNFKEVFAKQDELITLFMSFKFFALGEIASKVFNQPHDDFEICVNDNHTQREIIFLPVGSVRTLSFNAKMALAIKKSCSIGKYFVSNHDSLLYLNGIWSLLYHKWIMSNTLNDLTSGSLNGYAKVLTENESLRGNAEELPRQIENIWSLKSKRMLYVAINQQVTLQNQDPKKYGVYKSSLIDLEAYGNSYGDKAQA